MTPIKIDKDITRLLNKLNATHEPLFLDVTPEPNARIGDCFIIVREKVKKHGGRMILGWQIWKTPNLIEAEFHAVWENPDEELIDLTPKEDNVKRILFVEDENSIYEDRQIDNIRLNISSNTLVDDLITVLSATFRFYNMGERADLYDLSEVLNEKQMNHIKYLKEMQQFINILLQNIGKVTSHCPCRSGLKFKDCHRKNFESKMAKII